MGVDPSCAISVHPSQPRLAFSSGTGCAVVWDWVADTRIALPHRCSTVSAVAFSPDCCWLAVAVESSVALWQIEPSQCVALEPLQLTPSIRALAWSADSTTLLSAAVGELQSSDCNPAAGILQPQRRATHDALCSRPLGCFMVDVGRFVMVNAAAATVWRSTATELSLIGAQPAETAADLPPNLFVAAALDRGASGGEIVYILRQAGQLLALSKQGTVAAYGGTKPRASKCTALAVGCDGVYIATDQGSVIVLDRQTFAVTRKVS